MTKKEFKECCSFHQYGRGQSKKNAIFFDWKQDYQNGICGFKFMVKTSIQNYTRAELFNILWDWVMKEIQPNYYIDYKYAENDTARFKVPICG